MTATATTILAITPANLKKKLNPLGEPHGFDFVTTATDECPIAFADVLDVLQEFEDYVVSRLPEKYRALLRRVEGEVLTRYATCSGQSVFQLGLYPATNVKLYVDYTRPFADRNDSDECTSTGVYSFTTSVSGQIVLTPGLLQAQSLLAEYDHTASAGCRFLRSLVLNLSAAEWAKRLPMPSEKYDLYKDWETQSYSDLKRMLQPGEGCLGIDMFDRLDLVTETRSNSPVSRFPATGGW